MDHELELLLRRSAPGVVEVPHLAEHRQRLLSGLDDAPRRRRVGPAVVLGLALTVGFGGAAWAGAGLPAFLSIEPDAVHTFVQADGTACVQGWQIEPVRVGEGAAEVEAGARFLAGLDTEAIDTSQTEAMYRADPSYANATDDELRSTALSNTVFALMVLDLRAEGLDPDVITLVGEAEGC